MICHTLFQVVEWKYRGSDIFSFRSRWCTFDLWDFSGEPGLEFIYPCCQCHHSLHLAVFDARNGLHALVRWLADLQVCVCVHVSVCPDAAAIVVLISQSLCSQRLVMMVIFTHMDQLKPREEKEKFKKTSSQWLSYHNKQVCRTRYYFLVFFDF